MLLYESLGAIPSEDGHKHKFVKVNGDQIIGAPFYECKKCDKTAYLCFHEHKYVLGEPEEKSSESVNGNRLYCRSCDKEIGKNLIDQDDFNRDTD